MTTSHVIFEITAIDRKTLDSSLDGAEALAQHEAMRHQTFGILVTRHSRERFTVALSPSVPFGQTRELSSW